MSYIEPGGSVLRRRQRPSSNDFLDEAGFLGFEWAEDVSLLPRAALDLREPLTVLIGGIETIRRRGEDISWHDYDALLVAMSQRAHRLSESMAGVFLAEQLHRGLEPEGEPCPVLALVREAADGVLNRDEAGSVRFEGAPDAVAWCDRQVLRQLAAALLDEAIGRTHTEVVVRADADHEGVTLAIGSGSAGLDQKQRAALEAGALAELPLGLHVAATLARAVGARLEPYENGGDAGIVVHLQPV